MNRYPGGRERWYPSRVLFALVSDANGAEVRVTRVAGPSSDPVTAAGWGATDIHEAVRELTARGVTFERYAGLDQDADGVWSSPDGTRIAWFGEPGEDTASAVGGGEQQARGHQQDGDNPHEPGHR